MTRAGLVAVALLLVSACASGPASPRETLLAVVESTRAGSAGAPDTVVIAGLDGGVRAKASYQPLAPPVLRFEQGSWTILLPPAAYAVGDRVFFIDGTGTIRTLSRSNVVKTAWKLPKSSPQQLVSFAVSPDGKRLLATIVNVPSRPVDSSSFSLTFGVYAASAGSPPALIREGVAHGGGSATDNPPSLVGWDRLGPIGTYGTGLAPQSEYAGRFDGGSVMRLDEVVTRVSAATCGQWRDHNPDGTYVCDQAEAMGLRVVRPDKTSWGYSDPPYWYTNPVLAPDGESVAARRYQGSSALRPDYEGSIVVASAGSPIDLPVGFIPTGWATPGVVVGTLRDDPPPPDSWPRNVALGYVEVDRPAVFHTLGLTGDFVGALPT